MSNTTKNNSDFISNNFRKEHGFSIPKNYFDTLEDSLIANNIAAQFSKETGFILSENYFNSFEENLFTTIQFPKKETTIISIRKRMLHYIPAAAAACVLLFFGLNYFSVTTTTSFDNISTSDIENWMDTGNIDFNTTNTVFVDADFTESNDLENEVLNDEDYLDYFNTIDNTQLLTEIES